MLEYDSNNEREKIRQLCQSLESKNKIKILFAIESGSLVYGFPSKDSDRDIRFVYYDPFIFPFEKYISFTSQPLTIEKMFDKELNEIKGEKSGLILDVVGWHIYKYAELLGKSNAMSIEWLLSPILYYGEIPLKLKEFANSYFKPVALFHHYYNICKKNFELIRKKSKISFKKYLYPLIGAFKASYVLKHKKIPPLDIHDVLHEISDLIPDFIVKKCLEIIEINQNMKEKDFTGRIEIFDFFLEEFISKLDSTNGSFDNTRFESNLEELNEIIRVIILEDYSNKLEQK
ncbi:MAG: nucleotidyltransferase domain-containing protein [Candidatus Heimdallarchaeota archaeon]|nr:nucleotidyltransferase domain-containing protein [Candidatus Heimdallarchaeota archaeon]